MQYSNRSARPWRFTFATFLFSAIFMLAAAERAAGQMGQLISPGPLSKPHANLEGIANCSKCHEEGKKVSAARCLACHKPVAERIAQKRGVHRDVAGDCVSCHVEHMGRDAELRPFDIRKFDHKAETGFALEGKHAPLVTQCTRCHKTRSFLGLSAECASCHADAHKGRLGKDCAKCHSVAADFKEAAQIFDHARTAFPLEGAHRTVACAKCHPDKSYTGVKFASCADCHKNPHKVSLGANCSSCHTPASWKVANFDHARTGAPLIGRHAAVPCAKCHVRPATQVKLNMKPCAACHTDPHRGQFKQDCAACHNERGFKGAAFDHAAKTRFPLQGRHASLACQACHKTAGARREGAETRAVDFRGLSMECVSCHADPHKGQLGPACERCHSGAVTFKVASFTHPRFPEFYAGQHARLTCEQCHRTGATGAKPGPGLAAASTRIYRNLSTECASCHTDVHRGQLPGCTSCHAVDAPKFAPALFNHDTAAFHLTGSHATVACAKCHKSESAAFPSGTGTAVRFRGLSGACASCHADVHLGQLGMNCERCHTTATFAVKSFRHETLPGFFRGRHATAACADCHKKTAGDFPAGHGTAIRFAGIGDNCSGCHKDPHEGQLGTACASCHAVDTAWKSASRAFHKAGLFPLEGAHLVTPCASCHLNGVIKGTPNTCYDCHWVRRQDDRYRTRLGNQCEQCHRPTSWAEVNWNHGSRTGFPLNAAHRQLACDQCHANQVFAAATSDCASCHMEAFRATTAPSHQAAGFPTTCESCHRASDSTWHQAHFDHTRFPLLGAHQSQPCSACHANNVYAGLSRDCASCHKADYDRSSSPSHAAAAFGTACDGCHNFADATWRQGRYAHSVWPRVGAHLAAGCSACHKNNLYRGLPSSCMACHKQDYDRAANPPHASAGFPVGCEPCHKVSDTNWNQGKFDHSTFPLAGVHTTQVCTACHKNNVFQGTARTCTGCHLAAYNASKEPNHVAAGFSTTCESCHKFSDPSWAAATFDHSIFPLAGIHATQLCSACHKNNVFKGTQRTCTGCHLASFNSAQNPNHVAAGFPTTCETCHKFSDSSWKQGVFDHSTFPLAGVHLTTACTGCHVNNLFKGTARTCAGCHLASFNSSKNPNHVAAAFPTTCDTCHKFTDSTWQQGVFNHSTFPLSGVHATQACTACHANNVFKGTSRTCVGCHLTSFNNSKNPNHITAGFPTTCDTCHKFTDTTWQQGVFNHSTFPLSGVHATQACSSCHQNNVYQGTARTCVGCHLAVYNTAKNPNHVTAGFPTTCDTCHKFTDTTWQQGVFNHSTFPLAGLHATRPCSSCHQNNVYKGTPRTCVGCHLAVYNSSKNPNHLAAGFPTTCDTCHKFTDTSWQQGVFNHTWFPITSGKHAGNPCSACHTNPNNYLIFTCTTCHTRGDTDSHHKGVAGYRYDSVACYQCHPQGKGD